MTVVFFLRIALLIYALNRPLYFILLLFTSLLFMSMLCIHFYIFNFKLLLLFFLSYSQIQRLKLLLACVTNFSGILEIQSTFLLYLLTYIK